MANDIKVGDLFPSFHLLKEKLEAYEQENKVKFYIRNGQTLTVAKRRVTRKQENFTNAEVKYYELKYCCIHGGMTFKKKKESKGLRQTRTLKQGCKASIFLRLTEDGQHLEVTAMNKEHNHEVSEELYKRKLDSKTRNRAARLLKLRENNVLVQKKILKETGMLVTLKNLHKRDAVQQEPFNKIDHLAVVKKLEVKFSAIIRMAVDKDMNLRGLFIQDVEMRKCYSAYPEIMFANSTCKLLDLKVPISVLMVEDSNGQREVAAIGLLVSEDVATLSWFLDTFKALNPESERTRVVTTDRGMKERLVFNQHFPAALSLICAYHTLRTFKDELSRERFGISEAQQNLYLDIHQRMTFAKTEVAYDALYEHFQKVATDEVLDYFNCSWHPIRYEWALGMQLSIGNFIKGTNKRLETFNNWIKVYSTLETFVENLFIVLGSMQQEQDYEAAVMVQKSPTMAHAPGSPEEAYSQHLTLYAYKYVAAELAAPAEATPPSVDTDCVVFKTAEGIWQANATACNCTLRESMRLPCRHVFAVRRLMGLGLFDAGLCAERWTRSYYVRMQRIFQNGLDVDARTVPMQSRAMLPVGDTKLIEGKGTLTEIEKQGLAAMVTSQLASVVSEAAGVQFERRIEFLQWIMNGWKAGGEVVVQDS